MTDYWRPSDAPRPETPVMQALVASEQVDQLEDTTYIDTMSSQLDRALQLIHGTEAWFDANPQYDRFTFFPDITGTGSATPEKSHITITRDTLQIIKEVALTRFMDLRDNSELGYAIAQDVVESWKEPRP